MQYQKANKQVVSNWRYNRKLGKLMADNPNLTSHEAKRMLRNKTKKRK